jgi:hypothetical protein
MMVLSYTLVVQRHEIQSQERGLWSSDFSSSAREKMVERDFGEMRSRYE